MKKLWLLIPILLLLALTGGEADSALRQGESGPALTQDKPGAWLGVRVRGIVKKIKDGEDLKEERRVMVEDVVDDSPAEKAGIKEGDQLLAFNNVTLTKPADLTDALKKLKEGDKATVTLLRDGKQLTLDVVLGAAKDKKVVVSKSIRVPRPPRARRVPAAPWAGILPGFSMFGGGSTYGLTIESLDRQLGEYFGAPEGEGVLVKSVKKDSEAEKAGFKAGDVIVHAGKKTVEDVADFRSVLGAYDEGEKIPVKVIRKGKEMTVELTAKDDDDDEGERDIIMRKFGSGAAPRMFHFESDGEGMDTLDGLESDDFDIRVNVGEDELEEGVRRMRIMINGEELELEELQEVLQDHMEELREHMDDIRDDVDVDVDDKQIRIRTRKI